MGKGSGVCDRPAIVGYENPLNVNAAATTVDSTTLPNNHPAVIDAKKYPRQHNSKELNFQVIKDENDLNNLVKKLKNVKRVALDIETTGYFMPWGGSIRLIQIGIEEPEPTQFLIDCWETNPGKILNIFENNDQEIIMCGGRFEQVHLLYRYGIKINNIFDVTYAYQAINKTRARKSKASFKALMYKYVNKHISKTQQNSRWDNPVLSSHQLRYAAMDVAGLLDIRRQMGLDIAQRGLEDDLEWRFNNIFSYAENSIAVNGQDRLDQFQKVKRAINYSSDIDQVNNFYKLTSRLPLNYTQLKELESIKNEKINHLKANK